VAQAEAQTHAFHEHEHFGGLQTRLILTLIGAMLIVNSFLADYVFFPGQREAGAISALLAAIVLGTPIMIGGFQEMRRGRMHMNTLVAIAVLAAFVLGGKEITDVGGHKVAV
jgi:cation transport ATPase